ncbi:hypothetical protein [Lysinibacillus sp. Y5S-8]|uniref:hypothetical protein n=1 Tax=Lysinibacillus sp. Y5S-8 TaxID=3122488 RepID=UPI0030D2FD96
MVVEKISSSTTIELKEVLGITIEEWKTKGEVRFKTTTGMSYEQWYIILINSSIPIDYLKSPNGEISHGYVFTSVGIK